MNEAIADFHFLVDETTSVAYVLRESFESPRTSHHRLRQQVDIQTSPTSRDTADSYGRFGEVVQLYDL